MGYLIRVTDVKVTSACNKERRNKIKLDREASLNQKQKKTKKKPSLKKEGKKMRALIKLARCEDHDFPDQQLPK